MFKWFIGILHREVVIQLKQTLFLQIFCLLTFIEQIENTNSDKCRSNVKATMDFNRLSLLSYSICSMKATRPNICKKVWLFLLYYCSVSRLY